MDHFLILASLLVLAAADVAVGSHGSLPAEEVYWQKVLPNVPMPSALQDLLHPGRISVNVNPAAGKLKNGFPNLGKDNYHGQYVYAGNLGKDNYHGQYVYAGNLDKDNYHGQYNYARKMGTDNYHGQYNYAGSLGKDNYHGQYNYAGSLGKDNYHGQYHYVGNLGKDNYHGQYNYAGSLGKDNYHGQYHYAGSLGKDNYHGQYHYAGNLGKDNYHGQYNYAGNMDKNAAGKKSHNDSNWSLFFLEKDLQPGAVKSMLFVRNVVRSTFVPRQLDDSLPFSSSKLPEILDQFSIKPDTAEATKIETTLTECEKPELQGEHKFCATSLESLVESSMSALGTRSVQAVSTAISKEGTPKQPYTVAASGLKRLPGSDAVACHSLIYPYVVYYCHSIKGTRAYRVSLTAGKSETKVDAVAVCHTQTDKWNPEYIAFQVLNAKPGAVICHILPQDNLLWIPNK